MLELQLFQVDAFADALFRGNPAAVCPLSEWLPDTTMQAIAAENNLSETAFFVQDKDCFYIRWFTPNNEVALCGHATLASAWVLFNRLGYTQEAVRFVCGLGDLIVKKTAKGLVMDFPALTFKAIDYDPYLQQLGLPTPEAAYQSEFDLMLVYRDAAEVAQIQLTFNSLLATWPYRGLIVTAPGVDTDIYSRCFYPKCNVPEDPVTGSAHCVIAPYWCQRLGLPMLSARQGGARQGRLECGVQDDRVLLYGD